MIPWYGYSRQDKKSAPREPITAKLVADLLQAAGVDRVLTMDMHAGQIQGFYRIPVDHMTAVPLLADHFLERFRYSGAPDEDLVVVSPECRSRQTGQSLRREARRQPGRFDQAAPRSQRGRDHSADR